MRFVEHIPDQVWKKLKKCHLVGTSRGKLEKKTPRSENSLGPGWKTYTTGCVNLTCGANLVRMHPNSIASHRALPASASRRTQKRPPAAVSGRLGGQVKSSDGRPLLRYCA